MNKQIFPAIDPTTESTKSHSFSTELANLIIHKWDLMDRISENSVLLLYSIQELLNAINGIGWVEHTSDWDWTIEISMKDFRILTGYDFEVIGEDSWVIGLDSQPTQIRVSCFSEDGEEEHIKVLEISEIAFFHCYHQ